jgi:hypothetical protein
MAEDFRDGHLVTASAAHELAEECRRQEGNCLYTAAMLHIWLRSLRRRQAFFTVVPLVLGTIAGWSVLKEVEHPLIQGVSALSALLAGLLPAVYTALKIDGQVEQCKRLAAEFTNLRDRFRQAALLGVAKPLPEFEAEFRPLMKRMETARRESVTPPDWCWTEAQRKVKQGDYDPDPQPPTSSN